MTASRQGGQLRKSGIALTLFGAVAIAVSGCGSDNGATNTAKSSDASCASGALAGGGSTFQLTIEQQWSADYG
jgi:ABC-type phosphate transport system substrate-binding protein